MTAPRDRLLVWDIDGTLVNMDRAGERTWLAAIRQIHGRDLGDRLPVNMNGRTDTSVVRDILAFLGAPVTPEESKRLRAAYVSLLPALLPTLRPFIHPGVREALEAVHAHRNLHQALLTGNLKEGARLKLAHLGLWDFFEFGAYADDSEVRDELGPFVVARAQKSLGISFPPGDIYVIGDTPHDIACGNALGAQTIAVATGGFSLAELEALKPTHALENLADTAAFLQLVTRP